MLAGGLGAAGFTLATGTAAAQPGFIPAYHWCPGEEWHPEWGNNWEGGACHDDHHRDFDGGDHSRDYRAGYDRGGPPPWEPPPPPPGLCLFDLCVSDNP